MARQPVQSFIANAKFTSFDKAQEYGRQVAATIVKLGGRYLARGGQAIVAEGNWQLHYVAIVEFPSMDQATRWYESEEYQSIKPIRSQNAESEIAFVDGIPIS